MTEKELSVTGQAAKDFAAAIKSGDAEAFGAFYMGYADSLIRFLTRITGNHDDTREVTQEAFAALWENRSTLDIHTSLYGFVYGIARNMAFRMIRNRAAEGRILEEHRFDVPELDGQADEGIVSLETSLLLDEAIRNMPEQRRRAFELSRMDGMTYNEIAAEMGISLNTVRTHMTLALKELRAVLVNAILWFFLVQ